MADRPEDELLDWNAAPSPSAASAPADSGSVAVAGPKIDVILPAGGKLDAHFARVALAENKALIRLEGGALVLKAIQALDESGRAGRKILVGPKEVHDAVGDRVDVLLPDTGTLSGNIKNALRELTMHGDPPEQVLILTTDLAYIDGKQIAKFLDLCPPGYDFYVPVITQEDYLDRFPSATATFAKLGDGNFTTGCAYLVNVNAFQKAMPKIDDVIANRKNVVKLAGLLGFDFLLKYLFKKLTVAEAVAKIESILGCRGKAVLGAPAELAYDIDELDDYEYALRNR